ncbi:MAG: D-alanyl-D-alanine carboxypeptidase family protein, partial [Pseudomonadota bacterium]
MAKILLSVACLTLSVLLGTPATVQAAPYAAIVVDGRNGEVLHSRSADRRLHPASLTKMMTLYVAFEAIKNGEISLDQTVRVSRTASREPPSKLGLRQGQRISIRYLIRAAAIKSANDAATALGEAISGSERAFAQRMNATARALGMNNTSFRNAHGLTESGHLSTARDMSRLARHLFFDHAEYYNLFGRTQVNAGVANVRNTNWRLLQNYRGADGIKT